MLEKFSNYVHKNLPLLKDKKLLVAVSGGVDSVALATLLSALKFPISLAHCNFNLRGEESKLDEEFVKKLGKKLNASVYTKKFKTKEFALKNKTSIQITARNLRYNWFSELMEQNSFDYVLTAHHADDNLETFLINLTRGTGLEGLTGIPQINGNIVRPLLTFSQKEILTFVKDNRIDWREDKSNASTKYIRNKIRHQVIPSLKEINPSLLETFAKTTSYLKESQEIIEKQIEKIRFDIVSEEKDTIKISIEKLERLPNPKAYLFQLLKKYNFTEWSNIYNLLSAQSGKQVFSKTHTLLKDREYLFLFKKSPSKDVETIFITEDQQEITNPIRIRVETPKQTSRKNKQTIFLDKEKIRFPLKLRKWEKGDFFYPSGMRGKKKLSKYFKDEKFSLLEKQNTWLLCNHDNTIISIINHRQDSRFEATELTTSLVKISTL